jgi:hypothetical protein
MATVLEEADECSYWIDLLVAAEKVKTDMATSLHAEANELVAIAVSSINTARRNPESRH